MEKDIELERELDGRMIQRERIVEKNFKLDVQAATDFYTKEFYNRNQFLRVYVNEEEKRYFIDTFAAFALQLIPYEVACEMSDNGARMFEISPETLELLKKVFKDNIHYIYLDHKKEHNFPIINQSEKNDYNNKIIEDKKMDQFENVNKNDYYDEKISSDESYKNDIESMFNNVDEDYQDTDAFSK